MAEPCYEEDGLKGRSLTIILSVSIELHMRIRVRTRADPGRHQALEQQRKPANTCVKPGSTVSSI